MDLFKDYYDIGKSGSADKFLNEFKKLKSYLPDTRRKNQSLIDGAAFAFLQRRPENIQTVISNAKSIDSRVYPNLIPNVLFQLTRDGGDKLSTITLALAKVPEDARQQVLNTALHDALANNIGGVSFFSALLKAGAEPNGAVNGEAGILATAISSAAPVSFIKALHDGGAEFDKALDTLHTRGSKTEDVDRLEYYRKQIAADPAAAGEGCKPGIEDAMIKVLQTLQQMHDQIGDLTGQVSDLAEKVEHLSAQAANKNAPEEKVEGQKKTARKYPTI